MSDESPCGKALYGLAGWAYDDWVGIVYPQPLPRGFDSIAYLARYFDALEINSSFYRIPSRRTAEAWARAAAPLRGFEFAVKLWQGLTHARDAFDEAGAQAFETALAPLCDAGKLGAILIQFPWSFRATADSKAWLERLLERFARYPLAVEVRHASWLAGDWLLEQLRARGAAFCNIDQPALRDCIGLTDLATAGHAYLRVHGRNSRNWFRQTAAGHERYDYFYSAEEIADLAAAVRSLKKKARRLYVIANNHWRGQAPANALQLKAAAEGARTEAPECLIRHFGGLGPAIRPSRDAGGEQMELF
ncbi:MAG: hypothetical protein BWZ10_01429 [candidate division BRC1 bacterium ADurb.BinA364]|nr:MAG: hypothetical protein BWZ10_01429 [candidate division BRC1 bacterium ADurb.BinA364]